MTPPQIFVSRPAVLTVEQSAAMRCWIDQLSDLGFEGITVERRNYERLPWNQLRRAIAGADGALVLGFRQISVEEGCWRLGTREAGPAPGSFATSWSHVEAGLAIMAGIPLLVAPEDGVCDGVFAKEVWGQEVYGLAIEECAGRVELPSDRTMGTMHAWAQAVRARSAASASPQRASRLRLQLS